MREHVPHPLRPYDPLIINLAPTGMVPRTADVPHLPVTTERIVDDAERAFRLGAMIVHLHARGIDEEPDWRRRAYEPIIVGIRERCPGMVICVSTSGRTSGAFERRADVLRLSGDARPDMASLTLGSLNFRTQASVTDPDMIRRLAETMAAAGIKPELEIFDAGMAYIAADLADRGVLQGPLYANIMLGSLGSAPARADDLTHIVGSLPPGTTWAAAGVGVFQLPITAIAMFMGGHVRVGLEDNPYLDHRAGTDATNAALVERTVALAADAQREIATPAWTRAALGLAPVD